MAIITSVAQQAYAAGTRSVSSGNIDPSFSRVTATLTRVSWPNTGAEVIRFSVEISLDAGQSWAPLCSGGSFGGLPNTQTTITTAIPEVGNSTRRIRATVTNPVAITTAITVEAN